MMLLAIIHAFASFLLPEWCFQTDERKNKTDIFVHLFGAVVFNDQTKLPLEKLIALFN